MMARHKYFLPCIVFFIALMLGTIIAANRLSRIRDLPVETEPFAFIG